MRIRARIFGFRVRIRVISFCFHSGSFVGGWRLVCRVCDVLLLSLLTVNYVCVCVFGALLVLYLSWVVPLLSLQILVV